jgi:transposase
VVQRIEKVLEEANIKLDTVASDLMGVGPRRMLDELAEGNTDTTQMAEMALGRMRPKIPQLAEALEGHFRPHQSFLLKELLSQFDDLSQRIERFERQMEDYARPFERQIARLDQVPGIDRLSAAAILSETGVEMKPFPTPQQFCRWATVAPGNHQSAGKQRTGKIGKGNRWLRGCLTQCAWAATHDKKSYFSAQYRRLLHRGKQRALVAVAHSMLTVIWHLLQHGVAYRDLGVGFFDKQNREGLKKSYLKKLEKLGFQVTLTPVAA